RGGGRVVGPGQVTCAPAELLRAEALAPRAAASLMLWEVGAWGRPQAPLLLYPGRLGCPPQPSLRGCRGAPLPGGLGGVPPTLFPYPPSPIRGSGGVPQEERAMAARPEVDASIRHIHAETQRLRDTLASLPAEAWDTPSNC